MSEPAPLLARVAAGDQEAVRECVDRFEGLVWSLARRFTSSPADAEDAVQEIFIDLWLSAPRYDVAKGSETTFVATLARRRLIDRLRRARREPPMEELSAAAEPTDRTPEVAIRDDAALAARLLRTLTPDQQAVIRLAVHEGHTHQGVADALKLPLGTVKTHLRRGLLKIRDAMKTARPGRRPPARPPPK